MAQMDLVCALIVCVAVTIVADRLDREPDPGLKLVRTIALKRTFVLYTFTMTTAQLRKAVREVATKGRKAQGERTRKAILEAAVHIASAEGLEGLTIGRLALELSMSKSGLFAHFGSKEDLQVATVEAARAIFINEVIKPAFETAQGMLRLWKLCDIWLAYVQKGVFRGGCFFAAAAAEFDSRPGPVRDRIAEIMKEWLATLRSTIIEAQNAGQLAKEIDPMQLAFEFNSLELGANWAFQLHGDLRAFTRARQAIRERLGRYATAAGAGILALPKSKRPRA
jgi:Transcriptional regulator